VSTDFSPLANSAIAAACSALPRGGTLHLLHVRPAPPAAKRRPSGTAPRPPESRARQLAQLRALIPAAINTLGLNAEVHVVEHDHVARAICQEAERIGANVICIASHGRSGLSRALLGSVAHEVMHLSPRPVLVVRPQKA
jgi:nucleotide-binding universal stress UspA family protein